MNIKKISTNVYLTIFQVIVSGLVFFLLYKYLYGTLGPEKIGIWSLLIGVTSVSRIGELGLSGGVVKFISEAISLNQKDKASKIVQTIFITLLVVVSILIFISYFPIQNILFFATKQEEVFLIKEILPISFLSILLMILVGVLGGSLDGAMLMGFKNLLLALSHIFYLLLVYKIVPIYGLIGLAYAQCIQYLILLVIMWTSLKREIKELPLLPYQWDFNVIKDMFSYSINFQAISIVGMFWEPVIKLMMSYWGGLASLGFFEMANKVIHQLRNIIIESTKIVVPLTAKNNLLDADPANHFRFVKNTFKISTFFSFLIFSLLAISTPLISFIWFGFINLHFIYITLVLLIGYLIITLSSPIFLINLGTGHVRQNLYSYIVMATTSIIFGNILGYLFNDDGVTFAVSFSLISSAIYLGYWYKSYIYDPGFIELFSSYKLPIILAILFTLMSLGSSIYFKSLLSLTFIFCLIILLCIFYYKIFNKLNLNLILFRKI